MYIKDNRYFKKGEIINTSTGCAIIVSTPKDHYWQRLKAFLGFWPNQYFLIRTYHYSLMEGYVIVNTQESEGHRIAIVAETTDSGSNWVGVYHLYPDGLGAYDQWMIEDCIKTSVDIDDVEASFTEPTSSYQKELYDTVLTLLTKEGIKV